MQRLLSGLVLVAVLGAVIWTLPAWATAVLATTAASLAGAEFAGLARRLDAPVPTLFVGPAAAVIAVAFVISERGAAGVNSPPLGAVIAGLVLAAGGLTLLLGPPSPRTPTIAAVMVMAPLYIGVPLGAIIWVQWLFGPRATTWLIAVIAASDSAQYYAGRLLGRTRLAPAISPAKTVEGALGGIVGACTVGLLLTPFGLPGVSRLPAAVLAIVLALAGMVGDLFESAIKRSAGVKDSSRLIPGHGGLLDRIDSYLFAAPVFYIFLRYVA